jgi:MFS family permease
MSQTVGVTYPAPPPPPAAPVRDTRWGRVVAVSFVAFVLAGVVGGWIWQRYAPLALYRVSADGASLDEEQMTKVFGPDGTFVSIGFLAALVVGAALFWWLRDRGPWAVAAVVLCSAVGSGAAWSIGMLLGHDPLDPRLQAAKPDDLVAAPLEIHAWTALAAWPVGAALAVAIIAGLNWRHDHATVEQHGPFEQTPWPNQ